MEMANISLAKGLKLKNRLVGRLTRLNLDIQRSNSLLQEQRDSCTPEMLREMLTTQTHLREALISLKATIYRANQEIQEDIIRKDELKALAQFYAGINTMDGVVRHDFQNTDVRYVAVVKKPEADAALKKLEAEIDTIQDRLDEYNNTTKISVARRTLDLAS
jgi:hypothetical protein